ncbi:MAG: glycosyltransferase family 2 protein [Pseudomonadota bacterium]
MTSAPVTVVIPTFDRPDGLTKAVLSVYAQSLAAKAGFALVIVDNHPDGTGEAAIDQLRQLCPSSIAFSAVHEPRAGVANARNAAMMRVETDLVAFLDDDMTAPKDWLERLLEAHEAYPAPVIFGPVVTALPADVKRHRAYFEAFFARDPGHAKGYIGESYGCGNALIDFSKVPGKAPWFDETMNEIGGEDDRLFETIRAVGGQFAWASDAPVNEHPLRKRLTLNYTLRRAFSYGQGPVTMARLAEPQRPLDMLKWMLIGLGKAFIHGAAWVALSLIRHPKRAFQLDEAVRGLAKPLWFVDFQFYGASQLGKNPLGLRWFKPRPKRVSAKVDEG